MKKKELLNKSKPDLVKELGEKRLALRNIRFEVAGSKSKNVKEQRMIKRDIARISTILRGMN